MTAHVDVPNTIERELVLPHPVERVWAALTSPAELAQWFGDGADIDLHPGGAATFVWGDDRYAAVVDVVDRPHRFAFWWTAGLGETVTTDNRTRVEFTLHPIEGGAHTRLRLVESGFAALADGTTQHADNTDGWTHELADLHAYVAGLPRA